ncbi:hypothetical protein GQX73_g4034 [Xylaria multiplex]|uniref:AAA+ ATPase domain-containing protein n=1 Tax=Xylaria multiplex TaxID=323545 RepID=A0A7C8IUL0_9PEZI|nr:hypothetical protein GQX73_g4034 [Xylaria multiplex]
MESRKTTETDREDLRNNDQKSPTLQDNPKEQTTGEKSEDKSTDADNDQSLKEEEQKISLIPEIRCLSWLEWRKLRLSEYEVELKDRNKENQQPIVRPKRYAIDVVSSTGDMGPLTYAEGQVSTKAPRLIGRIRINSQHVIDILSGITNLFFPERCQMLHPFKVIIDNLPEIRAQMKIIEDGLKSAQASFEETAQVKTFTLFENEKSNQEPTGTKSTNGNKAAKPKEEKELEVAQERFDHYKLFMKLIETHLAFEVSVAAAIKNGTMDRIMFCHLWHLFPPGETIFYQKANRDEPPQAAQVLKVSGGRGKLPGSSKRYLYYDYDQSKNNFQRVSPFTIDAFHLDFDGKKYRPFQVKYEIQKCPGEFPITSLPVFPLRFLLENERKTIMSSLLRRGITFRNLAGVEAAHREYSGRTLDREPEDIDGRVIIDFKQAAIVDNLRQQTPANDNDDSIGRVFGLRTLSQTNSLELLEVLGAYEEPDLTLYDDHNYDIERTEKLFSVNKVLLAPSQELAADDLTDDELRLLPGTVYAYILRSRKYCRCDISFIKEITPNKKAIDSLVLPTKHKTLLMSLVDRHSLGSRPMEQKTNIDRPPIERTESQTLGASYSASDTLSIVKGKGRGLIILLHGVPGVGKTSTAETIAETTGRPLLPVTCGDIGENASMVEKNLEQIFTNSHRWGCVLLLDEAEVFLTKRNLQDLTRNAMVSVFLRALEFYSGILFLTTNRVGTIDEAFKSRIQISLYYPPLDWKTSKQIWQVNLERSKDKVQADKDELIRYAKKQFHRADENSRWNGRQIYNAFKTAIALAEFERANDDGGKKSKNRPAVLTESHFRQVAHVAKKFDEYLLEAYGGMTMSAANQEQHVRADGFGLGNENGPFKLKRRPTKSRKLDYDEMSSTSEGDSESGSVSGGSTESDAESEVEVKKSKKKGASSSKRNDERKRPQNSKSKKSSKRQVESESEDSS